MSLLEPQVVGIIAISATSSTAAPASSNIDSLLTSLVQLRSSHPPAEEPESQVLMARGKWYRSPGSTPSDVTLEADLDLLRSELFAEYQQLRK